MRTLFKCVSEKSGYGFCVGATAEIVMDIQGHSASFERVAQDMAAVVGAFFF